MADKYTAGTATIDIEPSLDGFAERCRAELARMQIEYNIDVDADVERARAQLARVREDLSRDGGPTITLTVDPDRARTQLDAFRADIVRRAEAINREAQINLPLDVDGERLRAQFEAALARLRADANVEVPVDPELAAEARARLQAQLDELTRSRTVHVRVDDNGSATRAAAGAANAHRSFSALGALKFTALASAITALVPALVGAAGAASMLGGVLAGIGGTGLVGISGITGAFEAMKAEASASGSDVEAAANKIADAQDGVRRAQEGVADAQRAAKQAQDDLNDSYEKASRNLRDMNDQLVDAELSQEGAEIALARAQTNMAKTMSDPKASGLDRAEAALNVKQAQQRLRESKSRTADQREDTADANAKGIGGSDIVTSAQDAKVKADQALTNAQVDLAKATRELADAQKGATPGADKYAEALAKLSPNARDFVQQIKALGPEWKELKNSVQDKMFDGLGASVTKFANENLAGLKTTMGGIAGYMNGAFKDTLSSVSGLFKEMSTPPAGGGPSTMQSFIEGIGSALQGMAPMITGLIRMVTESLAAAGPALGTFFTAFGKLLGDLGPTLGQIGGQLLTALTPVLPVLGDLIKAISTGLGPALGPLGQLIATLGSALVPLAKPLGDLISALATGLAPILPSLGRLIGDLVAAVVPLIEPLLQLATAILKPMIGMFDALVVALSPFIKQLADMLKPVIEKMVPIFQEYYRILGPALTDAIKQLTPIMLPLIQAFLKLVEALLPLLPPIAEIAAQLLPLMLTGFKIIAPVLTKLIELFTEFVSQVILPIVLPALEKIGEWLGDLGRKIGEFVDSAKERWDHLVDFVKELPGKIANAASGLWDGIKNGLKEAINWVLEKWNDLADKLTFTVPDVWGMPNRGQKFSFIPHAPLLKADGGPIAGPGGPRADMIPALLSNGEYVMSAAAVAHYGQGTFDQLNTRRFADGGPVGYGLPAGSNSGGYGGKGVDFPAWVNEMATKFGVLPSTYGTHQESERSPEKGYAPNPQGLNRGIDWQAPGYPSADSIDKMQKFAEWLASIAASTPQLEQIIWKNPNTGQKIGLGGAGNPLTGGYYPEYGDGSWEEHNNHVHTRWSAAYTEKPADDPNAKPSTVDGQDVDGAYDPSKINDQDGRNDPQKYAPEASTSTSGSGPKSWTDVAGIFGEALFKGQLSSALGVFGIPEAMPPLLTALTELPGHIVKRDENWKAPGLGNLTTPTTNTGGTQVNPLGEMLGKLVPGLAKIPGFSATPATPNTTSTGTGTPTGTNPPARLSGTGDFDEDEAPKTGLRGGTLTGFSNGVATYSDGSSTNGTTWTSGAGTPAPAGAGAGKSAPSANYNGGTTAVHDAAYKAFTESGFPDSEWAAVVNLINNESSWNPTVTNSIGAYGLPQFLGETKTHYLPDNSPDPYVQVKAMMQYIKDRPDYGTPSKAWELWQSRSPHWYARGGLVSGPGSGTADWIPALVSNGEYVVNSVAAGMNLPLLNAINSGARITTPTRPVPAVNTNAAQAAVNQRPAGGDTNYYIRTATVEDAFMQAQTRQNQDRAAQLATL